jgi:hypothetical protein
MFFQLSTLFHYSKAKQMLYIFPDINHLFVCGIVEGRGLLEKRNKFPK